MENCCGGKSCCSSPCGKYKNMHAFEPKCDESECTRMPFDLVSGFFSGFKIEDFLPETSIEDLVDMIEEISEDIDEKLWIIDSKLFGSRQSIESQIEGSSSLDSRLHKVLRSLKTTLDTLKSIESKL